MVDPADQPDPHETRTPGPLATPPSDSALPIPPRLSVEERRTAWLEIALAVFLGVLPHFLAGLLNLIGVQHSRRTVESESMIRVTSCLQIILPLLILQKIQRRPWSDIGLPRVRPVRDLLLGLLVFVSGYAVMLVWWQMHGSLFADMWKAASSEPRPVPATVGAWGAYITANFCNSVAEELVIWGFTSSRLFKVTRSEFVSIVVPAALFSSYHAYQGAQSMSSVFVHGLVHGVAFRLTGRLWPNIAAHSIWNVVATLSRR